MKKKNIFKLIFYLFFLSFLIAYIIEETGYYEYKLQNRMILTNEQMKKFEEDAKSGKDVTLEDYVINTEVDYRTHLTNSTNKLSNNVNIILKKGIEGVFKVLGKFVEE